MEIKEIIDGIYELKTGEEIHEIFVAAKARRKELMTRKTAEVRKQIKGGQKATYEYKGTTYHCTVIRLKETRAEVQDDGSPRKMLVPIAWLVPA